MTATLRIGSLGPEVKQFQTFMNMLPSLIDRLTADGIFGAQTRRRAVEFQRGCFLQPDGIVGPITWAKLVELVAPLVGGAIPNPGPGAPAPATPPPPVSVPTIPPVIAAPDTNDAIRQRIVAIAEADAILGGVSAKSAGGRDAANGKTYRLGHETLLKYFRVSAPDPKDPGRTYFNEDGIRYLKTPGQLDPCPHWCGIFALWAIKSAGVSIANWKMGVGASGVDGLRSIPKKDAKPGDVGYVADHQHHFIIKEVGPDGRLVTIEGNSAPASNHSIKTDRTLSSIGAVYTAFR